MQRAVDQEVTKRKWSADKAAGPLVLLAEHLKKKLIQHAWPCDYVIEWDDPFMGPEENAPVEKEARGVMFAPLGGRPPLSSHFWDAFDAVLRIVTHEKRVAAYRRGAQVHLDGPHYVDKYGKLRRGNPPPPF